MFSSILQLHQCEISLPRIWDIETGTSLSNLEMKTSVRGVNFSYSGTMIAYTTDKMMGHNSELNIIDVREPKNVDRKSFSTFLWP